MSKEKDPGKQPNAASYMPKQALIVYSANPRADRMHDPDSNEQRYYLEISDIMYDQGKSYLSSGKPLTKETLRELMEVVSQSDKRTLHAVTNLVPKNLLILDQRAGRHLMAWWSPAQKHTVYQERRKSVTLWVPPLVYLTTGDQLHVAALAGNRKPSLTTRLHHAPFFNVYQDMKVCLGTVKAPRGSGDISETIAAWEKAFWNSEFTETVTGAYSKKDLIKWWRKKRHGKFNIKKLKLSGKTLKGLCGL